MTAPCKKKTILHVSSFCAFVILSSLTGYAAEPDYIWFEGEDAKAHTFPETKVFAPNNQAERDVLSGGAWLQTNKGANVTARWEVNVSVKREYVFWARVFWKHGPFRWRWNGGSWTTCGKDRSLADSVTIRLHLGANWVRLGKVKLPTGKNVLEIEAMPEAKAIAFDCLLLTPGVFTPNGKIKPGQKYNRAPEGWFSFEPDPDLFGKALLDVGQLLSEKEAGSKGRIIARGSDFVFEKTGEKVRFWSVVAGSGAFMMDRSAVDNLVNRLAKSGVNMVRIHLPGAQETKPGPITAGLHYLVYALKKKGIYSYLLWYCTAGNKGGQHTNLFYFSPEHQAMYRGWARCVMGSVNPHTGMSLAKDPAVMAVELLDEDSLFFWTFKPERERFDKSLPILEKRFGDWLSKKYGSINKAASAWGPRKYPKNDNFGAGRVALYDAGHLTGADWAVNQRNTLRAQDQAQFMTELMRGWYAGMKTWLEDEFGYTGIVIGSNWKTADERVLGPLDQQANLSLDAIARNTYFSGGAKGPRSGYSIGKGQFYKNLSLLKKPEQAILMHIQLADRPHLMTEGGWSMPNRFRTEEPFLIAGYYSLQGVDAYAPFIVQRDWLKMQAKWPIQTPATMGQYPAASIIYRKGYIKEGPVVINDALKLEDMYALKGATLSQRMGLDAAQASRVPEGVQAEVASLPGVDPLSFYVGRVIRTIGKNPGKSSFMNTSKLIDRAGKKIHSATGELMLDYGRGLATMNAPCAQGVTGFTGAVGAVDLKDLSIHLENEYGAVMVVSLDGKPLATSAKILLQVMTEEKNFGWKTKPAKDGWLEIIDVGAPPICVRKMVGTVSFKRSDAARLKITALDFQGYAREELKGGAQTIKLLPDCLYYIIETR